MALRHGVGLTGRSGSGKTTLIEGLVPALAARGHSVSVIKHAHHGFELDVPGKDSWRHRQAGAQEVLVASPHLLALQRPTREPTAYTLPQLLDLLQPVDWVLLEGYRQFDLPKLEVWRPGGESALRCEQDPRIVALVTDDPDQLPAHRGLPVLDLNDPQAVADWLLCHHHDFILDHGHD